MKPLSIALAVAIAVAVFFAYSSFQQPPAYFDDASPVLYFYRDDCSHCIDQKAVLGALANEGFRVAPAKYPDNRGVFQKYGVEGTPTFVAPASGAKLAGYQSIGPLRQFLQENGARIK
jgi:thioredoxin-like negative regulator of GroEL